MVDRDVLWALAPLSGALWAMGGSNLPPAKKNWRRVVLPLTLAAFCWLFTHVWWVATATAILAWWASIQGYGDRSGLLERLWAGICYGMILVPLTVWHGVSGKHTLELLGVSVLWFLGGLVLTKTIAWFQHKWFELAAGAWIGAWVARCLW